MEEDEILLPTKVIGPDGDEQEWSLMTMAAREEFALRYRMRMEFSARYTKPSSILAGIQVL